MTSHSDNPDAAAEERPVLHKDPDKITLKHHNAVKGDMQKQITELTNQISTLQTAHEKEIAQIKQEYSSSDSEVDDLRSKLKDALLAIGELYEEKAKLEATIVKISLAYSEEKDNSKTFVQINNFQRLLTDIQDLEADESEDN